MGISQAVVRSTRAMAKPWSAELELRGAGGEPVDLWRTLASHGVADLLPNVIDEDARTLVTVAPWRNLPAAAPLVVRLEDDYWSASPRLAEISWIAARSALLTVSPPSLCAFATLSASVRTKRL